MYNSFVKINLAILVVLLGAMFFWRPLSATFSGASVTNDFVLQTTDGALDTKQMRGKLLLIAFASADCGAVCAERLVKPTKAYDLLSAPERSQVRLILVSADPERDTAARIRDYARGINPAFVGATGKPEEVKAVAEAFAADLKKVEQPGGGYIVTASTQAYLVGADGRFVAVLSDMMSAEEIARALRERLPRMLPPQ